MNTFGCPEGTATDETFAPSTTPCDTSLTAYDAAYSTLFVIRVICLVFVWHDWLKKKRTLMRKSAAGSSTRELWKNRQPLVPLISSTTVVAWLASLILVRFDLSSASNGVSFFLWAFIFNAFAAYSMLYQRKLVALGKKILPISRAKIDNVSRPEDSQAKAHQAEQLTNFDTVLTVIYYLEIICVTVQAVSGMVLALVFPGEFLYMQIAWIAEGIYMIVLVSGLTYQLQRVYWCVVTANMGSELPKIRKKMRSQQFHFMIVGYAGAVVQVLLTVGIFPARWYIMMYWISIEISVSSFKIIEPLGSLCVRRNEGRDDPKVSEMTSTLTVMAPQLVQSEDRRSAS